MPDIINYKEEVKRLICDSYEPADMVSVEFKYTTKEIVCNLKKVLPDNAVDEHLIYEALQELNFEPKEESPLEFYWYFKRKNHS